MLCSFETTKLAKYANTYEMNWDEGSDYLWTDGNYSCDCNRELFFCRAAAEDEPEEHACGESRFAALKAILPDGTEIEIDGEVA